MPDDRKAASGICAGERKHGRRRSLFDYKENVMVRVLYKNISFPIGAYSFVKSAVLKIMSNFVDAFAQAKLPYKLAFVVCENALRGSVCRLRRSLRADEQVM